MRPKRDKKPPHWRLPKGVIEKDEASAAAAQREVEEEAGIKAKVIAKVGQTNYFYTFQGEKIFKIIVFFLMEFSSDNGKIDPVEVEEIVWLPLTEAKEKLTFAAEKEILAKAEKLRAEKKSQPKLF